MERREVLRFLGIASVAGAFPGFSKWAFACGTSGHAHEGGVVAADSLGASAAPPEYKPMFFSAEKFRMVETLTELIIPADGSPGAREAGVAEFIDFMAANRVPVSTRRDVKSTSDAIEMGIDAQNRWLAGLAWLNARSKSLFGHEFMEASADERTAALEELAYKAKFKSGTESGREFFSFVRDYVVVGFYTTKVGLESIGYPGLRVVWPAMPACPHENDRDHRHLAKAG
jgi:gluconate 2-dehydrogenase gamma chain